MFKLQRWWRTKQFNISCDCWQHSWSLILEFCCVSVVEDKGFQQISGDCWHHLRFLTLEFSFFQFFCFAPCYYKLFSIKSTHKATRVLEGKNFLLLLVILCLGSLTLQFGSISFFQFFCFTPCYKFFLIEGTHKTTKVQGEELSIFPLLATLCLGSC